MSNYIITYQERALIEYESATQWYRQRSEQADENFEIAVKEKIDKLRVSPNQYKHSYKQFHEVCLKRYPYNVIYLIDEKNKLVIISSIFHHKRRLNKKYR